MNGCVFNVQRYSVHDGPGIRTIVFLKGCPLHCAWCANPESQQKRPQIAYHADKCIGGECLMCQRVCKEHAIFYPGVGAVRWEMEKCIQCGACARICPAESFISWGQMRSVEDIIDDVEKDQTFYSRSQGGMTLSGGEPLLQAEFSHALLLEAKRRGIHTAMETTLYCDWEIARDVIALVDYLLVDIKSLNSDKHRAFTGVGCERVLENFQRLKDAFPNKPIKVRTPVIPTFNDTPEDILAIYHFVQQYPGIEYELLKYHRFGQSKYEALGRMYPMGELELADETFDSLKRLVICE